MKASKVTDAQKAFVIKQGEERTLVAEACRKAGIGQATHFNWERKYAGGVAEGDATAARTRGGERPAQADRRRSDARRDVIPRFPPAGIRAGRLFCASARLKQWAA